MWKVYRILKASEGGIVELTAFLMESFFFIGAALFYYGCNLYDASERAEEEAEEEGILWEPRIRPTTINHIWLIGCLSLFYDRAHILLVLWLLDRKSCVHRVWVAFRPGHNDLLF